MPERTATTLVIEIGRFHIPYAIVRLRSPWLRVWQTGYSGRKS